MRRAKPKHSPKVWVAIALLAILLVIVLFSSRKLGIPTVEYVGISPDELFVGQRGVVEVETALGAGQQGILVAKHDYEEGKAFRLGVNVEGTVFLELSDSDTDITLESAVVIGDGKKHTVVAGIDGERAWLSIDGRQQAEERIAKLKDISSAAPLSVGADTAYEEWTREEVEEFSGSILAVKAYLPEVGK